MHFNPGTPLTLQGQGIGQSLNLGLFVVMWNYLGWDGLSTVAGEVENPRKTFPLALAIMIPAITLVYLLPVLAGLAGSTDWQAWTAGYFPVLGATSEGHCSRRS